MKSEPQFATEGLDEDDKLAGKEHALVEKVVILERRKSLVKLERREKELQKGMDELSVEKRHGLSRERRYSCTYIYIYGYIDGSIYIYRYR